MRILTTIMLLGYVGGVIFMTLYSSPDAKATTFPKMILGISADKIAHFVAFLSFTIVISIFRRYNPQLKWLQRNIVILIIGLIFAVGTEALQLLTDTRSFNEYDIFANIYGIVTGLMISKVLFKRRHNNYKH